MSEQHKVLLSESRFVSYSQNLAGSILYAKLLVLMLVTVENCDKTYFGHGSDKAVKKKER